MQIDTPFSATAPGHENPPKSSGRNDDLILKADLHVRKWLHYTHADFKTDY